MYIYEWMVVTLFVTIVASTQMSKWAWARVLEVDCFHVSLAFSLFLYLVLYSLVSFSTYVESEGRWKQRGTSRRFSSSTWLFHSPFYLGTLSPRWNDQIEFESRVLSCGPFTKIHFIPLSSPSSSPHPIPSNAQSSLEQCGTLEHNFHPRKAHS